MNIITIIFFGSTSDSVVVLKKLVSCRLPLVTLRTVAVVTQPPKPIGRKQVITPTPVAAWAKEQAIPVLSFPLNPQKPWLYENENAVADTLAPFQADLIISASYGQKIPDRTIREARYGGINVHPSLLPRWRGADPVPWAILAGDRQIGVTIVTLNERFDEGVIIAQKKIPITDKDTSDPLRTKLFTMGADLLTTILASKGLPFKGSPGGKSDSPYARKFTREDGFIPWEFLEALQKGETTPKQPIPAVFKELSIDNYQLALVRALRALSPWPGLWTIVRIKNKELRIVEEKRLKILEASMNNTQLIIDTVQLEGKKPVSWNQFSAAYLPRTT